MVATQLKQSFKLSQVSPLQIIIVLTILQLLITLLTDGFVLSYDEAIWHFIGRNWFRYNLVPYAGGVDNKSPLIFAIFGLSDKLFGVNYWFPRVLGTLCQSVGLYYVYKIAQYVSGRKAGILALSFYGLSLLWRATGNKYVSYTETYEVTFVIIAFYYYLSAQNKKHYLLSGCMAGLAIAFRLTAFFAVMAIFISLIRKNSNNTFSFCLGALISFISLVLVYYLSGINMHDLFIYGFADNFRSGNAYDYSFLWKIEQFSDKFLYSEVVLLYPLTIGYCIIKKRADLFVLWLVFAFAAIVVVGGYTRVHVKEVLPALSLMSAFALAHLAQVYKMPLRPAMIIIWIVFFPKLLEPLINLKKVLYNKPVKVEEYCKEPYLWPDEETRKKLGWWIKQNTGVHDKVFVTGFAAQIQVYSERQSIYFNGMQTRVSTGKLFKDLQVNKPAMILVPLYPEYKQYIKPQMRNFIDSVVARDYTLYKCMYSHNIYKLKQ